MILQIGSISIWGLMISSVRLLFELAVDLKLLTVVTWWPLASSSLMNGSRKNQWLGTGNGAKNRILYPCTDDNTHSSSIGRNFILIFHFFRTVIVFSLNDITDQIRLINTIMLYLNLIKVTTWFCLLFYSRRFVLHRLNRLNESSNPTESIQTTTFFVVISQTVGHRLSTIK